MYNVLLNETAHPFAFPLSLGNPIGSPAKAEINVVQLWTMLSKELSFADLRVTYEMNILISTGRHSKA